MTEAAFLDALKDLGATDIELDISGQRAALSYVMAGEAKRVAVNANKPIGIADVSEDLLRWVRA